MGRVPNVIYFEFCDACTLVVERRCLGMPCLNGHGMRQVAARLRCSTCRWTDPKDNWHKIRPACPGTDTWHTLEVLEVHFI